MSIIKYAFSVESLLTKEEIVSKINNIEKESSFAMWFGDRSVYDISSTGDEFSIRQKPFYECFGKRGSGIKAIHGIIHPLAGKSKIDIRLDYPNWGSIFTLIVIIWCLVFSIISDKANLMAALVTVVLMSIFPLSFFTYKKFFTKLFRKKDLIAGEIKKEKSGLFHSGSFLGTLRGFSLVGLAASSIVFVFTFFDEFPVKHLSPDAGKYIMIILFLIMWVIMFLTIIFGKANNFNMTFSCLYRNISSGMKLILLFLLGFLLVSFFSNFNNPDHLHLHLGKDKINTIQAWRSISGVLIYFYLISIVLLNLFKEQLDQRGQDRPEDE